MSCVEHLSIPLRERGFRMTTQRMTILHILNEDGGHLTPSQVYDRARQSMTGITEPTVYRTLEFLAENGMAFPTQTADGRMAYEIAAHEHHHLLCRECGQELEITHRVIQQMYRRLEKTSGFQLTGGHLTFIGLCPHCR
jgi:Fur family transcriptional regulator, ferric uptake regulator